MDPQHPYKPRVSREMRLLLTAAVIAIAVLWLLARLRFRDLPAAANPIPAVLTQLGATPRYDDLGEEIAQLRTRLDGSLVPLSTQSPGSLTGTSLKRIAAIRFREGMAVALVPHGAVVNETVLARDPASGLTVVRVPDASSASVPPLWTPRQLERPRYFIASDVTARGVSLRPAFLSSLEAATSASWAQPIWTVSAGSDLDSGAWLFTSDAELVGIVSAHADRQAVVPAAVLLAEVERLLARPDGPVGTVGVEVQALTTRIAAVTGASVGLVVAWVEPKGAAVGLLTVGDVIEALDDEPLTSEEQWDVRVARLVAGQALRLRVRRAGKLQDVVLQATSPSTPSSAPALGLLMRVRSGTGSEVMRVDSGSAAERAGLMPGDVITLLGVTHAPTPARIARGFASLPAGQGVLLGVTRGDRHLVTALER